MNYLAPENIMYVVLVICVAWLMASVLKRSRHPDSAINIEDLLLGEDGRVSKTAVVMLGAFLLTTWMMIYFTAAGKMTEGYFTIYVGAWVTPTLAKIISPAKGV